MFMAKGLTSLYELLKLQCLGDFYETLDFGKTKFCALTLAKSLKCFLP